MRNMCSPISVFDLLTIFVYVQSKFVSIQFIILSFELFDKNIMISLLLLSILVYSVSHLNGKNEG
jgi:hypothetical protein